MQITVNDKRNGNMITRSISIELTHEKRLPDGETITRKISASVMATETNAPTLKEWREFEKVAKKIRKEATRLYKEGEYFALWVYASDYTFGNSYHYAWTGEADDDGGLYFRPFTSGQCNTPETLDMYAEDGDIIGELVRIGF